MGGVESAIDTVRRAYKGFDRREVEPYKEFFAEGFAFHMRPEFPVQGVYGVDEMEQLWADLDDTFSEWGLTPTTFEAVGDYVIVRLSNSTKLRGSEARFDESIHHVWQVRDGLIQQAWTFTTYEEAVRLAAAEPDARE